MKFFHVILLFILLFATISLTMLKSIAPSSFFPQALFFALGVGIYCATSFFPFVLWRKLSVYLFVILFILLFVTLIAGKAAKGSTRWLSLGVGQIQPSQFAKPVFALFLSCYLASYSMKKLKNLAIVLGLSGLYLAPVFLQPDLGTTIILFTIVGTILFFSDLPPRWMFLLAVAGIGLASIVWIGFLHDFQRQRLLSFLFPQQDVLGTGYHAQQAIIAIGSGKIFGRGLGHGIQSGLQFLPEKHTDFFFASLAEELGFLGTTLVLLLYTSFFATLYRRLHSVTSSPTRSLCIAVLAMLSVQTIVNIGMNIGLLPITGITLPLLSSGGSSIVSICFSLGLVVSALRQERKRPALEIRSFS